MSKANSIFVKARCLTYNKIYYLRYDLNAAGRWILSESIDEKEYQRETKRTQVGKSKELEVSTAKKGPQYKGCPHCGNRSFVTCSSCPDLHCFDGHSEGFTCPSNGKYRKIRGHITTLKGKKAGQ